MMLKREDSQAAARGSRFTNKGGTHRQFLRGAGIKGIESESPADVSLRVLQKLESEARNHRQTYGIYTPLRQMRGRSVKKAPDLRSRRTGSAGHEVFTQKRVPSFSARAGKPPSEPPGAGCTGPSGLCRAGAWLRGAGGTGCVQPGRLSRTKRYLAGLTSSYIRFTCGSI